MTQYIPKSALLEEIKRLDALYHTSKDSSGDLFIQGLFCFLDTFKVKEVDLEKEIEQEYNPMDGLSFEEFARIAKHFVELGIKIRKEEVK